MKKNVANCPLCLEHNTQEYSQDKFRSYLICNHCELIFVPRLELISNAEERTRYEHHQNESEDPAYFDYLSKIANSCEAFLHSGNVGLDFGCGPSPLLAKILSARGFQTDSYDLYFHPDFPYKDKTYDFIILSEVIEHLRNPLDVMQELRKLVKRNGQIFIKTKLYPEKALFDGWFYKRDITHVQFFNLNSLNHLAKRIGFKGSFKMIGEDLFRVDDLID